MSQRISLLLSFAFLFCLGLPRTSLSDQVTLVDGRKINGIDFKPNKKTGKAGFTLENGKRVLIPIKAIKKHDKTDGKEKVTYKGKTMTLKERIKIAKVEKVKLEKQRVKLVEKIAQGKKDSKDAKKEFLTWNKRDQEIILGKTLLNSKKTDARLYASRELVEFKSSYTSKCLIDAALSDKKNDVRKSAFRSLRILKHEKTPQYILPYIVQGNEKQRIRASEAVREFPSTDAVGAVLVTLTKSWSGFGRGFIFQGTQRAFIGDYELVSGGTGFSIVEVADPVVSQVQTGVVLDVKVTRVESKTHFLTLNKLTGENYGSNFELWKRWWIAARKSIGEKTVK